MKKAWEFKMCQQYVYGEKVYDVHAAIRYAEDLEVFDLPLKGLNLNYACPASDFYTFVQHVVQTKLADLTKPIILNYEGAIIDGKHRLAKALSENLDTIKAVQFDEDPEDIWSYKE